MSIPYSIPPHLRLNNGIFEYAPQIQGNGFMIFSYLSMRRNAKTGRCYPSLKRIANDLGLDKKTVIKYLKILEEVGLIIKHATYRGGKRAANQYDILFLWNKTKEAAKTAVNTLLNTPPPPPEIPIVGPSLDEMIDDDEANQQASAAPPSPAVIEKQQTCQHPEHSRRQPVPDYAFCGICYVELSVACE